jgi:DNA uptake protein ComE-like DNA-binding protein
MTISSGRNTRTAPGAFALLAVLVFIMLLSMITVSLLFRSRSDETAAQAGESAEQSWAAAMSGVQEAIRVAASAVPGNIDWQDNPAVFRDRFVVDDGADRWFFTVYSPTGSGDTVELRNGLSDEAGRINLNRPGAADLSKIPRVTAAMAQALRQYVGVGDTNAAGSTSLGAGDTNGGPFLAGADANSSLPLPPLPADTNVEMAVNPTELTNTSAFSEAVAAVGGVPRHGPLATLDELVLVPGFSWMLLYGEDANMNGHLDPNEDDGDASFPPDNHDGRLDHGMAQYFTVSSYDPDRNNAGKPRVNINDPKAGLPAADFPSAFTNFLAALHAAGLKLDHPSDVLEGSISVKDAQGNATTVASGIGKAELPLVLDAFTSDMDGRHDGLINVNTASAAVLATLPGVDLPLAETIVSTRTGLNPAKRSTIAWLVQEGVVDSGKFKQIAPYLTARASQYRFQVLGYGIPSGRYRVLQAVIDVAGTDPQITYLRDITRLGLPFRPRGDDKTEDGSKDAVRNESRMEVPHA